MLDKYEVNLYIWPSNFIIQSYNKRCLSFLHNTFSNYLNSSGYYPWYSYTDYISLPNECGIYGEGVVVNIIFRQFWNVKPIRNINRYVSEIENWLVYLKVRYTNLLTLPMHSLPEKYLRCDINWHRLHCTSYVTQIDSPNKRCELDRYT